MSMERGLRLRAPVVLGALFAFVLAACLFAWPARADCGGVLSPVNGTGAGGTLCGSPSPSPSPSPTPTHSPTPTPSGSPTPPPYTPSPGGYPPFGFPTPAPFPTNFPVPAPNGNQELLAMQRLQQQLQQQLAQQQQQQSLFGDVATVPTLAGARPATGDGGFTERALTLVFIGLAGAAWIWRARVRRWMIGG